MIADLAENDKPAARHGLSVLQEHGLIAFGTLFLAICTLPMHVRMTAIRLLPYLDRRRAPKALLLVLESEREEVVCLEIAKALATRGMGTAVRSVVARLRRDASDKLRYWLCYVLACLQDDAACEVLVETLDDQVSDSRTRSQAAEALAYSLRAVGKRTARYRRSVNALIRALYDANPEIRFWAAFALGSARAKAALGKLREMAQRDKAMCPGWWSVATEAADAIRVIRGGDWPQRIRRGS